MQRGSFAHFMKENPFSQVISGLSIAFVCGQVEKEGLDTTSNVYLALDKIKRHYGTDAITSLTVTLYDCSGCPLSLDRISHKYEARMAGIKPDYHYDECYPHCHWDTALKEKKAIEKDVVISECHQIIKFLREHKDCWACVKKLRFICCHYVNIPDDVYFLLEKKSSLQVVEKLDDTRTGPVFDLTETSCCHGYTPWRYSVGKLSL